MAIARLDCLPPMASNLLVAFTCAQIAPIFTKQLWPTIIHQPFELISSNVRLFAFFINGILAIWAFFTRLLRRLSFIRLCCTKLRTFGQNTGHPFFRSRSPHALATTQQPTKTKNDTRFIRFMLLMRLPCRVNFPHPQMKINQPYPPKSTLNHITTLQVHLVLDHQY